MKCSGPASEPFSTCSAKAEKGSECGGAVGFRLGFRV